MLDLPKSITDKALLEFLCPGCVIRTEVVFPDGEKAIKRLIVLTIENERTILSITTTRTPANNQPYRKNDIFVASGKEKVFEENTYLQLHRVLELETYKMQNNYNSHGLDVLGNISGELLGTIYQKISASELIERKYIQRILKEKR
jgi:hypothetical protein